MVFIAVHQLLGAQHNVVEGHQVDSVECSAQPAECLVLLIGPAVRTPYHCAYARTNEQYLLIAIYAIRVSLNRLQVFRCLCNDLGCLC